MKLYGQLGYRKPDKVSATNEGTINSNHTCTLDCLITSGPTLAAAPAAVAAVDGDFLPDTPPPLPLPPVCCSLRCSQYPLSR